MHRLNHYQIPVLPEGLSPMRILQVSDLHFRNGSHRLARFIEGLADVSYDIVFATGDLLGEPEAMPRCVDLLNKLQATTGRYFVFGSSDYYAPKFKNYLDYFAGRRGHGTRRNRTDEFRSLLEENGWGDLTNRTLQAPLGSATIQLTGMDDPYLRRDDPSVLVRNPKADVAICVVHDPAPYRLAVRAGFDLIVSGHTHGGQVRMPFVGALVTNSTLPRQLARGLSRINGAWLFVTTGLGTGKYAPFRFMCPPEASVLELVRRDQITER